MFVCGAWGVMIDAAGRKVRRPLMLWDLGATVLHQTVDIPGTHMASYSAA